MGTADVQVRERRRSLLAALLPAVMRITRVKAMVARDLARARHNKTQPPASLARRLQLDTHEIAGNAVWVVTPPNATTDRPILFLHGGAYLYGVHKQYWGMIEKIALACNVPVIIPDYPLIPEHDAADAHAFVAEVYDWVAATWDIASTTALGDSAGAGLALGFCQTLRDEGRTLPRQLILMCPWLDVALDNPEIAPLAAKDPELSVDGLREAGRVYSGEWDTDDHRVSPIHGALTGLPPMSIFIGTHDIFYADTEKFRTMCQEQQLDLAYYVYPKLFHDWMVVSALPESRATIDQVAALVNSS